MQISFAFSHAHANDFTKIKTFLEKELTEEIGEGASDFFQNYENSYNKYINNPDILIGYVSLDSRLVGYVFAKYWDHEDSVIVNIQTEKLEHKNEIREMLLLQVLQYFPQVTNFFIDIYKKDDEELHFYKNKGFMVYEDESEFPIPELQKNPIVTLVKKRTLGGI